jgi:solute:Na+ symporter, SSS family
MESIRLGNVDYAILIVYTLFVLGIGFALKRYMKTSTDFFLSGRSIPAWITGLAFISANLGAQEVMGMGGYGAKYGIMTSHFYWLGAIPAMIFVGIFMMPFYYGSKARSVPEYLKLRFDEKTRGFNAISFAVMTVFSSGISMFLLAKLLTLLLGWGFDFSLVVSALIVLAYIFLGGLTSAIYNEVLQFFLIVFGFLPLVLLGLKEVGGWNGLVAKLDAVAIEQGFKAGTWTQSWAHMGHTTDNPMNVEWFGMVMGLGFVLSFGYWCTDFLVVQRAMAANSMSAARRTPLIAAFPKMFMPFLVILPGMLALSVLPHKGVFEPSKDVAEAAGAAGITLAAPQWGLVPPESEDATLMVNGVKTVVRKVKIGEGKTAPEPDYNMVVPMMLIQYFPTGLLGLGLTALMASFMSGMAGNVTAFNTVWTYDIYQSYIAKNRSDNHYLWMGRMATVAGIGISIAAAYIVSHWSSIMDLLQLVFAFVNAPLFATFMLGMFWRRATGHGAFVGLLAGTGAAAVHHALTIPAGATTFLKGGWLAFGQPVHTYRSELAQGFWTAIFAWTACFVVTIIVSLATKQQKSDEELHGLVYSLTPHVAKDEHLPWYGQPGVLAIVVLLITIVLNVIFW